MNQNSNHILKIVQDVLPLQPLYTGVEMHTRVFPHASLTTQNQILELLGIQNTSSISESINEWITANCSGKEPRLTNSESKKVLSRIKAFLISERVKHTHNALQANESLSFDFQYAEVFVPFREKLQDKVDILRELEEAIQNNPDDPAKEYAIMSIRRKRGFYENELAMDSKYEPSNISIQDLSPDNPYREYDLSIEELENLDKNLQHYEPFLDNNITLQHNKNEEHVNAHDLQNMFKTCLSQIQDGDASYSVTIEPGRQTLRVNHIAKKIIIHPEFSRSFGESLAVVAHEVTHVAQQLNRERSSLGQFFALFPQPPMSRHISESETLRVENSIRHALGIVIPKPSRRHVQIALYLKQHPEQSDESLLNKAIELSIPEIVTEGEITTSTAQKLIRTLDRVFPPTPLIAPRFSGIPYSLQATYRNHAAFPIGLDIEKLDIEFDAENMILFDRIYESIQHITNQ